MTSCAGYRYQEKSNPFKRYGISSVKIPMFYNHSGVANVSAPFTREFITMLSRFQGLKILNTNEGQADAVLIGVISSPNSNSSTIENQSLSVIEKISDEGSGRSRRDFYIPSSSRVNLRLRIIMIKNPTEKEIKVLSSEFGKYVHVDSKVLINESILLSETFNRERDIGEAGNVNYTQNTGAVKNTIETLAERSTASFRSLILYAF